MECPVCHQQNDHVAKNSDIRESLLKNCSQCGTDLTLFRLLDEEQEVHTNFEKISSNVKKSFRLNKISFVFVFFFFILTMGVIFFTQNIIKNYYHVSYKNNKQLKVENENIQVVLKNIQKEFSDYRIIQQENLSNFDKAENRINQLEDQIQHQKIEEDARQLESNHSYIYYNGKNNLWNLSKRIYGHGKYFLLFLHLNPFLKTERNSASYLKAFRDFKMIDNEYQKITVKEGKNIFYRYTVQEGDEWSFIFWRFKSILKGKKADIIKTNETQGKFSLASGMVITLPLK